jgi:hypothetical protein
MVRRGRAGSGQAARRPRRAGRGGAAAPQDAAPAVAPARLAGRRCAQRRKLVRLGSHPPPFFPRAARPQATFLYGGLLRELAHQQLADMLGLTQGSTVGRVARVGPGRTSLCLGPGWGGLGCSRHPPIARGAQPPALSFGCAAGPRALRPSQPRARAPRATGAGAGRRGARHDARQCNRAPPRGARPGRAGPARRGAQAARSSCTTAAQEASNPARLPGHALSDLGP